MLINDRFIIRRPRNRNINELFTCAIITLVSSETELFLSVQPLPGYAVISWYLDHYNYFLVSGRIIKIIVVISGLPIG